MESSALFSGSRIMAETDRSAGQVISCLVDGCDADLSLGRDYYRLHKVCERHGKAPKVSKTIRPMGRKAFKKTMKGEGSKDSLMVDLLKKMLEAQMEEQAKYYAIEDAKIALAREHYAKIEQYLAKMNQIREREQERREREQEDRIIEKDVNDPRLSDVQRQYFMKMQEQILHKRFSQ